MVRCVLFLVMGVLVVADQTAVAQKDKFTEKVTVYEVDPKTGKEKARIDSVRAYKHEAGGKTYWHVWTADLKGGRPDTNIRIVDKDNTTWKILKAGRAGQGEQWICTCEKIPKP